MALSSVEPDVGDATARRVALACLVATALTRSFPAAGETPSRSEDPETAQEADNGAAAEPEAEALLVGRVVERGSGRPLSGEVEVAGQVHPVGPNGRFSVRLPPGTWEIVVRSPAHAARIDEETLAPGERVEVTYRLEEDPAGEEVVVYADRREEVARRVLDAEELRRVPGSFGDPIRALQTLPSVARPHFVEGAIVVRGGEAINTGTWIDEVPVPFMFHFFVGRSIVNPALLQDVEFLPGGLPVRFSGVTQAVVNARTIGPRPDPGVHGRISADLMDFAAAAEGRLGERWSWQAGWRISWLPTLISTGVRIHDRVTREGYGEYPTLGYQDHLLRVSWEEGPDRLAVTVFGARDRVIWHPDPEEAKWRDPDEPEAPFDRNRLLDTGFERVQLRWDRREAGREQTTWLAVGPDLQSSLLQGAGLVVDGVDNGRASGWTIVGRRWDRVRLDEATWLRIGADAHVEPVRVENYGGLDEEMNVPTHRDVRTSVGAWGEIQRSIGRIWVAPGLRLGGHAYGGRFVPEPEPRLTVRRPLTGALSVTAFVGRLTQVAPVALLTHGLDPATLPVMRAWQATTGLEARSPSGLELDLTVYGTRTTGLLVRREVVELQRGFDGEGWFFPDLEQLVALRVPRYVPQIGLAYGVEAMARARPRGPWFGWVAVGLGRALRIDPDGTVRPSRYDLPASATFVGIRELPWQVRASARFRVTSGFPYTPVHPSYAVRGGEWEPISGDENAARLPTFRQLDVRVDRTWIGERARWTLYLDVLNALNTRNYILATWNPNYTRLRPTVWIPVIPTAGLEVSF